MATKIPNQKVDGQSIEVTIADGTGEFCATVGGYGFKADTLKALLEKVRRALRTTKTRLHIEASLLHEGRDRWNSYDHDDQKRQPSAEPIILTGIHAGTGRVLMTRASGEKGQSSYSTAHITRRLSAADAKQWVELCVTLRDTEQAKTAFLKKHTIGDVDKFVAAEVAKASGEAPTAPGDAE